MNVLSKYLTKEHLEFEKNLILKYKDLLYYFNKLDTDKSDKEINDLIEKCKQEINNSEFKFIKLDTLFFIPTSKLLMFKSDEVSNIKYELYREKINETIKE